MPATPGIHSRGCLSIKQGSLREPLDGANLPSNNRVLSAHPLGSAGRRCSATCGRRRVPPRRARPASPASLFSGRVVCLEPSWRPVRLSCALPMRCCSHSAACAIEQRGEPAYVVVSSGRSSTSASLRVRRGSEAAKPMTCRSEVQRRRVASDGPDQSARIRLDQHDGLLGEISGAVALFARQPESDRFGRISAGLHPYRVCE